ncbi:hypothetical protein Taro_054855 [Colocasia esculenta]|uniref:Uncharacterized protein n=1 Tax=Colocasia esculenta TaxID=4460 RepID=A0A843XRW8_COLES|nr:hypothetical protein [Colocasia esculenta]
MPGTSRVSGRSTLKALPSDEEGNGSIRRVLNLKATPYVSLSGYDRIHVAFSLRVATRSSSPSILGRYVTFRSEADTLVVATWWRQVGRRDLVETGRALCAGVGRQPFWGLSEGVPCVPVPTGLVVTITWDPHPRAPVRGSSPGGGRAQATDSERHPSVVSVTRSLVPSVVAPECVVSLTSWCVQGPGWFCLWALDLVEVEVAVPGGETSFSLCCLVSPGVTPGCSFPTSRRSGMLGACVMRLWSHLVTPVFHELLCLGGCVPRGCFRIVLLSPDPGCGSWHCSSCFRIVVLLPLVGVPAALAGGDSLSQEFVAGRSWWQFVVPCVASSVSCLRIRGWWHDLRGSLAGVREVGSLQWWLAFQQGPSVLLLLLGVRAASVVVVSLMLRLGSCSRSSSLLVLVEVRLPQNCVVLISGCCGVALWVEVHRLAAVFCWCLPELFLVVLVRGQFWLVSASCCATSGLWYAVVVLAVALWRVFPERRLGGSGGVPVVGCFASFLAPYVLSQMVV